MDYYSQSEAGSGPNFAISAALIGVEKFCRSNCLYNNAVVHNRRLVTG
jgi:hypothetical protein